MFKRTWIVMLTTIRNMYGPRLPWLLTELYVEADRSAWRLLGRFWTTQNFGRLSLPDRSHVSSRLQLLVRIVQAGMLLQALACPLLQVVKGPPALGDADHRHLEVAALGHRVQCGKDLLERQIARGPEKHERVGMCLGHRCPFHEYARGGYRQLDVWCK